MARKKKTDPEYVAASIGDNLVRIAIRYRKNLEDLRKLNPDIKGISIPIIQGKEVRIT